MPRVLRVIKKAPALKFTQQKDLEPAKSARPRAPEALNISLTVLFWLTFICYLFIGLRNLFFSYFPQYLESDNFLFFLSAESDRVVLLLYALTSCFHCILNSPFQGIVSSLRLMQLMSIICGVAAIAENLCIFESLGYSLNKLQFFDRVNPLHLQLGKAPVFVLLLWWMVGYPSWTIAILFRDNHGAVLQILAASVVMTCTDLATDPIYSGAGRVLDQEASISAPIFWGWTVSSPALWGVPVVNFLAWWLVSLAIFSLCEGLDKPKEKLHKPFFPTFGAFANIANGFYFLLLPELLPNMRLWAGACLIMPSVVALVWAKQILNFH
jgi:uncharacterized membrane protein